MLSKRNLAAYPDPVDWYGNRGWYVVDEDTRGDMYLRRDGSIKSGVGADAEPESNGWWPDLESAIAAIDAYHAKHTTKDKLELEVGDPVRMLVPVYESGEDLPRNLLADKGEILIVRRALEPIGEAWRYAIGHARLNGSFWVNDQEIEPANAYEPTSKAES